MSKDFVDINISNNDTPFPSNSKLFYNLCCCNLILLDAQKEEWFCDRCNVSYFPNKGEKIKRANKFSTPGPETYSVGKPKLKFIWLRDDSLTGYLLYVQ